MNHLKPVDGEFEPESGKLAENVAHFGRALRVAGMPVGPAQVIDAVQALETIGIGPKEDFYWTLHAVFVRRHEHDALFAEAFELFWRKRGLIEKMMGMLMPSNAPTSGDQEKRKPKKRVSDAMFQGVSPSEPRRKPRVEMDATYTASDRENFKKQDFEQMTAAEIERAKAEIAKLRLVFKPELTRRYRATVRQAIIDPRRTLKSSVRGGGGLIDLKFRERRWKVPPLVAICDISGSMSQYSRMFLHFLHALTNDRHRVHAFLFGTQLTNISRNLRHKDVDDALEACSQAVLDWSGGTRISLSIETFNKEWSRRVLSGGATVLLITDGLERDDPDALERQMERLHKSCKRLIWLNPLLRYDAFEAKARGIKAMLPHVDDFRAVHSLSSLRDLIAALAGDDPRGAQWERSHHVAAG